jgi:DnaJ-class molecular chaperone
MNLTENYYAILGITKESSEKEIKKAYYKLSFTYHPDKGGDANVFSKMTEAYDVLMDNTKRSEYDKKSKWGREYNELYELLNYEFDNISKGWDESKYEDFKKKEVLSIVYYIDDDFDGELEYERWVICKECKGSGKDTKSKIEIKDAKGNILKIFDSEDGCDFCEGTGKDYNGNPCSFCFGQGKVGAKDCQTCKGEKRILGKQKLSGIKMERDQKDHKIEFMGNFSKDVPGKVGHLWIVRKSV